MNNSDKIYVITCKFEFLQTTCNCNRYVSELNLCETNINVVCCEFSTGTGRVFIFNGVDGRRVHSLLQ